MPEKFEQKPTDPAAQTQKIEQQISLIEADLHLSGSAAVEKSLLQDQNVHLKNAVVNRFKAALLLPVHDLKSALQWFQKAHVVHTFDSFSRDELEKRAADVLQIAFQDLGNVDPRKKITIYGEKLETKAESLTKRANSLMQFAEVQLTEEARRECAVAYLNFEKRFNLPLDEINRVIVAGVDHFTKTNQKLQSTQLAKYVWGEFVKQYPKLTNFMQFDDGRLTYQPRQDQEKWDISLNDEHLIVFRQKNAPQVMFVVMRSMLLDDAILLEKRAALAEKEYKQTQSGTNQKAMKEYDLPKNVPVAHLRVVDISDGQHFTLTRTGLANSTMLNKVLQSTHPQLITRPPLFAGKSNPKEMLHREFESVALQCKGKPFHVCLDVFSHGKENNFRFGDYSLDAKDIVELLQEFPQCTLTMNTIACYGGGMIEGLMKDKKFQTDKTLQSRLAVFTHAKGDAANIGKMDLNGGMPITDANYLHLMDALLKGKSYGEAAFTADMETMNYAPTDAEAVIHGQKHAQNTRQLLDQGLDDSMDAAMSLV